VREVVTWITLYGLGGIICIVVAYESTMFLTRELMP
jgi:hypothetical protein